MVYGNFKRIPIEIEKQFLILLNKKILKVAPENKPQDNSLPPIPMRVQPHPSFPANAVYLTVQCGK